MNPFMNAAVVFMFIFNLAWLFYNNSRWGQCSERAVNLDDYAYRLSGWETGQKVRSVAFVKFWRRCEKAAGLDPELGERFNALVEEFRLEDEADE